MLSLYEQYRPKCWSDVLGQAKVIGRIDTLRHRGLAGRAYWLSGQSGTGKTTIARLLADELADEMMVDEVDAETLTPTRLQEWERSGALRGWGKGGRVYIVNEAHGMGKAVLRQLLVTLERIPSHVVWIFTTTREGEKNLFGDHEDAHPLMSRCCELPLTTQGLAKPFAERARDIAQAEGLNGQPLSAYVRLLQSCKNNMRQALQRIENGEMLPPPKVTR